MPLTCPECGRVGFTRLTRHLSQVHGLPRELALLKHPGLVFEELVEREIRCVSCGEPVVGYSGRAANVKCGACRETPVKHQRGGVEDGLVACRVCGLQRRRLAAHVQAAHGLSVENYQEQFPGAALEVEGTRTRSEDCRAKQSQAATRRWSSEDARRAQSERLKESAPWKGKTLTEEHRAAISAGGQGLVHDVSVENRLLMGERGRSSLAVTRALPDYSRRLAEGFRRRILRGEIIGMANPETRAKGLASRIRNGTLIPPGGGRGITGFRKGIPHYCRSTLEANFARILILEGIPYEYEPKLHVLPSGRHYTPDFRLVKPLRKLIPTGWVELKGWRQKDGTIVTADKVSEFESLVGELVFVLTLHDDLWATLEAEFKPKIDLWETPTRNLRTHREVFARE